MLKNLEEKFKLFCKSKNLEVNNNQLLVIKKLQDYYKKILNHLFDFFQKGSEKSFYLYGDVGVGKQ